MDIDTATFLHMVERQAKENQQLSGYQENEVTEDQIVIAFMVASIDVLGKSTPHGVATGFDEVQSLAMRVIHIAEAEGFIVIGEER